MASGRQKESFKSDIFGNSRKTMQFNERTDRSLNAELSQLDRNRKEIMRDLRKIKQIKSALQEQLNSVLDHRPINRSVSHSKVENRREVRLPTVRNRQRFHSDMGPLDRLVAKEKVRMEMKVARSETMLEGGNAEPNLPIALYSTRESLRKHNVENFRMDGLLNQNDYKTNQEIREELMIKSRFNQLGSKFVGKEIFDKKHVSKLEKSSQQTIKKEPASNGKKETGKATPMDFSVGVKDDMPSSDDTNLTENFSSLSILKSDVIDTFKKTNAKIILEKDSLEKGKEKEVEMKQRPLKYASRRNNSKLEKEQELQPKRDIRKLSVTSQGGPSSSRKLSIASTGALETERTKREPVLPSIPLEFRSTGQAKGPNSLEKAFMVCHQMNSEGINMKSERKRRFAHLVDMVVKQRKVIKAWEPILTTVGDIQSDDEV